MSNKLAIAAHRRAIREERRKAWKAVKMARRNTHMYHLLIKQLRTIDKLNRLTQPTRINVVQMPSKLEQIPINFITT